MWYGKAGGAKWITVKDKVVGQVCMDKVGKGGAGWNDEVGKSVVAK